MKKLFVLYDAQCSFCVACKKKVKKADTKNYFQWVPISSKEATNLSLVHGKKLHPLDPESFVVCDKEASTWLEKSDAIYYITKRIKGPLHILSYFLLVTPTPIADWLYGVVSRNRNCFGGTCNSTQL